MRTLFINCYNLSTHYLLIKKISSGTMKKNTGKLLSDLRALMRQLPNNGGSINAYIIPTDDSHQSEYIGETDERRSFISGFTGSAGTAVVTEKEALLWTDGRYFQQAEEQLDENWTLMKDGMAATPTMGDWLSFNLAAGDRVGVDGNLISSRIWSPLHTTLSSNDIQLSSIKENLIDLIWRDQPPRQFHPIIMLDSSGTGKKIGDALESIRDKMREHQSEVLVISALDEVAWFLNLRGSDIAYNPVFYSYVLITLDEVYLFVEKNKLPDGYEEHFRKNNVSITIDKYNNVQSVLKGLISKFSGKVWISSLSSYALSAMVPERRLVQEISPVSLMKAMKNSAEAQGLIDCHIRDGMALCQYFAWLEDALNRGEKVDEISGATKLQNFREKLPKYVGLSFPTINGSGPNGAIIHYHPEPETNRPITLNEMYLCDSGAQFLDGTTDVTRTWHFGQPTEHQIDCFTRVLKGQISFGTTVFPVKLKGMFLDVLARKSLWDVGLDYQHGTGHGIGHFLNVHEGPMYIGMYRTMPDDPGLQANMFVSNEPGYYEKDEFGVRIEDIVQIVPANVGHDFNGRGALTFKTVTMCPIQTKLINKSLLTEKEKTHLNEYHAKVRDTLKPLLQQSLDQFTIQWLEKETQAI